MANDDPNRKGHLPRDVGSRIGMGCLSVFWGYLFGFMAISLMRDPKFRQPGFWDGALLSVVGELLLTGTLAMALLFVWALAAPQWIETLFQQVLKKLILAISLGIIAAVLVAVFASALGIGRR